MADRIQSIPLPNGWKIETLGKERIAGGFIHFIKPNGEIHLRIIAQEFSENPQEAAKDFLEAFQEATPNLLETPLYGFEIAEGVFLGGSAEDLWISSQHPIDRDVVFDPEAEKIYYDIQEWHSEPEEVIGAFLLALLEELNLPEKTHSEEE